MTFETAIKASKIMFKIKELEDSRNEFMETSNIDIYFRGTTGAIVKEIQCTKGSKNQNYIVYILDGLDKEIKSLKEELSLL